MTTIATKKIKAQMNDETLDIIIKLIEYKNYRNNLQKMIVFHNVDSDCNYNSFDYDEVLKNVDKEDFSVLIGFASAGDKLYLNFNEIIEICDGSNV